MTAEPLLSLQDLTVRFRLPESTSVAVDGISLDLKKGEVLGIVGESGSGKSQILYALMGLLAANGDAGGRALFQGQDLLSLSPRDLDRVRGQSLSMIFQDPMTSLNPYMRVGDQLAETLIVHQGLSRGQANKAAIAMLERVRIPDAASRARRCPHEFSGGMRQRIMIAIALACRPKLLIADEPTTALDVTIQAQVLELITDIRERLGMAVVLITHDLGVVAEHCDRVMVMYAGQVVEEGPTDQVIATPRHPYTRGLLASIPRPALRGQPLTPIQGQVPDLVGLPPQCRFHSRCPLARPECLVDVPMMDAGPGRRARCLRLEDMA